MHRLLFGGIPTDTVKPQNNPDEALEVGDQSRTRKASSFLGKLLFPGVLHFGSPFRNAVPTSTKEEELTRERLAPADSVDTYCKPKVSVPGLKLGSLPPISLPNNGDVFVDKSGEPPTSKEFRRVCSEVVPGKLFVSGWLVAEDWGQLESFGITHVINTACSVSKCPFPDRIIYLPLSIEDSKNEDVQAYFYVCFEFLEEAFQQGGKVLIHCMEGVSRSCTIAIAYLMWKNRIPYSEAHERVQRTRPICQPNAGFLCQLLAFQKRFLDKSVPGDFRIVSRVTARKFGESFVVVGVKANNPMDPRFAYVSQTDKAFTILVSPEFLGNESHVRLAREFINRIHRIEGAPSQEITISVSSDVSSLDFRFAIDESFNSDEESSKEYLTVFRSPPLPPQDLALTERSHKSHGSIDSDEQVDPKVSVFLFQFEKLEGPIPHFDSDDLDSRSVYIFVSSDTAVVWIGNETESTNNSSVRTLVGPNVEIHTVHQGNEPDFFWNMFQEG